MIEETAKKSIVFIVNPISGTSKKTRIVDIIEQRIDRERYEAEIWYTEYAGHASLLAKKAVEAGIDVVVAVGGDGTVNEVASSLVHTRTALAIIPCGSGNGLARHLSLPLSPEKAVDIINRGEIHLLDSGLCDGKPFFCTCGVGFDAFISEQFSMSGKRGPITYVENILMKGLNYQPETYTIEDEQGTLLGKAFLISCANASQYGNNAFIAPDASMKDGLLDVVVIEPFSKIEAPQIALALFNKTLPKNSHVKIFRARKIRITRQNEGVMHCDGDPINAGKIIEVEMLQKSLYVVVNPDAHRSSKPIMQMFTESFGSWHHMQMVFLRQGVQIRRTFRKLLNTK